MNAVSNYFREKAICFVLLFILLTVRGGASDELAGGHILLGSRHTAAYFESLTSALEQSKTECMAADTGGGPTRRLPLPDWAVREGAMGGTFNPALVSSKDHGWVGIARWMPCNWLECRGLIGTNLGPDKNKAVVFNLGSKGLPDVSLMAFEAMLTNSSCSVQFRCKLLLHS